MKRNNPVRLGLATLVAAVALWASSDVALAQCYDMAPVSANITAPMMNGFIQLGYDDATPELLTDVEVSFLASFPGSDAGDQVQLYLDGVLIDADATSPVTLTDVGPGAHTVSIHLFNSTQGADYCNAVDAKRFYVSRVCYADADCADADPCTNNDCIPQSGMGGWTGRCRFGPSDDTDCCVGSDWCAVRDDTFANGEQLMCADVDGDLEGDCVECTVDGDCPLYSVCQTGATCTANECVYTYDPLCCETDAACDDGNACTTDSCNVGNTCDNVYIDECCLPSEEAELPGDGTYGCTPADASPCDNWACVGQGADARCRVGRLFPNCCGQDSECGDERRINSCTDPDGDGFGVCDLANPGLDPEHPNAHLCTYEKVDEDCCEKAYECADHYPAEIGVCTDQSGDGLSWDICVYSPNPEYCTSPVTNLIISEIMVNSAHIADPAGEWFEIFNPTEADIDIEGWTVAGDAARSEAFVIDTLADELIVPAGGFVTLAASAAPELNGGFTPDYVYDPADLSFGDIDGLYLFDDGLTQVSAVDWNLWLIWAPGYSMALIHPYLSEAVQTSWARSSLSYGTLDSYGTPGSINRDVFDDTQTGALGNSCDDGLPCTLDVCNLSGAHVCSHMPLFDCCEELADCEDYNVCTTDSCGEPGNANQCVHDDVAGCCLTDDDCLGEYPEALGADTVAEQANFDTCAVKVCLGGSCRFGRDTGRPGCCVATDAGLGFGCGDRNTCTVDICEEDAGGSGGDLYPACVYDNDLDDDGTVDCCRSSDDCDDGDPTTRDFCNLNAESEICTDGAFRCCHPADPNYCDDPGDCDDLDPCTTDACGGDNQCTHTEIPNCCRGAADCFDGLACTLDICCDGTDSPEAGCTAANVCYNPEVGDASCCENHDDCNGASKPAAMFCRQGYCIGGACRYAPPADEDCCVTDAECGDDPCTDYSCTANSCVATPIDDCCETAADCTGTLETCQVFGCVANACAVLDLPNCCTDDHPDGPDDSCFDDNPCTADYCTQLAGGAMQCRYFSVGGAGCCATSATCPNDDVQCTEKGCDENACTLSPTADCLTTQSYEMSFAEGHIVYAGEYETLADIAWTTADIGTNPASQFFGFATAGDLGADQHLAFTPTSLVTNFESCAVMPRFQTTNQFWVSLSFEYAADWLMGTGELKILAKNAGSWETATVVEAIALIGNVGETAVVISGVEISPSVLDSDQTQFAFCIAADSTDNMNSVSIDSVTLELIDGP